MRLAGSQAAAALDEHAHRAGAALRARADLITPQSLHTRAEPVPPRLPLHRRPTTWLALVVVLVLGAGAALALDRVTDRSAVPEPPGDVRDTARGDLDGDGRDDRAWIVEPGRLVVGLADGRLLRADFPPRTRDDAELIGIGEVGMEGQVVVATDHNPYLANVWVWRVEGDDLRTVPKGNLYLTVDRRGVVWVDEDGRLLSGIYDQAQGIQRRVWAQQVWSENGVLTSTPFEQQWCWDAGSEPYPRECREGESFGPYVGDPGDLPPLYPPVHDEVGPDTVLLQGSGAAAVMVRVRGREFSLVRSGQEFTVQLPPATFYSLSDQTLDLGGTTGWLLRQGLPHRTRALVVIERFRRPVVLPPPIGDAAWGQSETEQVWPSESGRLYSRRHITHNRYQVWQWHVERTRLTPRYLGEVCFDDFAFPHRYGRC